MNAKFSKLFTALLCLSLCLTLAAGCNSGNETSGTESNTAEETAPAGIKKSVWESRFTDEIFENYTVVFEGRMTVTQNGEVDSTSDVWQKVKVTSDKMELTMRAGEVGSPEDSGEMTMVLDGESAEVQKVQNSQLFLLILRDYDLFAYNAGANTYTVPEPVVLEEVLKGFDGEGNLLDVPTRIEIREAVVSFTADGKLSSFRCDYSQTMEMNGGTVNTSGNTTWTFSDFGTTVIEQ